MEQVYQFLRYNVLFALLPLVFLFGIRTMAGKPAPLSAYVPEILFIAIMVSITAIGDIGDRQVQISKRLHFRFVHDLLLWSLSLAIGLYAIHTAIVVVAPQEVAIQSTVAWVSGILSGMLCLGGITAEILLARVKEATP